MIKKIFFKFNFKLITIIALTSFILLNIYIGYRLYFKNNINKEIVRLHIVANSNDIDDQIVKLKVNENIENYINSLNSSNLSTQDILKLIKSNSNEILEIANNTLKENNKNYKATLEVGKIQYDEKDNMLIHMDEGVYNSTKIILGSGNGKNIWSFIFPNEENISKLQNYETIMPNISKLYNNNEQSKNNEYKSKIIEMLNELNNKYRTS
jgi:stage II sporulation protein R